MTRRRVPLFDNIKRVIFVEDEATIGATVGKDLKWPDGEVIKEAELRAPAASGTTKTLWSLIAKIPAIVSSLVNLATDGFVRKAGNALSASELLANEATYDPAASGLTATDVQAAIDELKTLIGGGGGGSVSILSSVASAQVAGPAVTSTSDAPVPDCTVTVPASGTPRVVYVSFFLQMNRVTHLSLALDTVTVYPLLNVDFFGGWAGNSDSWSGAAYQAAMIPITIPGDGLPHDIGLEYNAQSSTGQCIFYDRFITVMLP